MAIDRYHGVISQILYLEGSKDSSSALPQALKGLEELLKKVTASMGQPILYISRTKKLVSTQPDKGAPQRVESEEKKIVGSTPGEGELYKLTKEGLRINTTHVNIPFHLTWKEFTIAEGSFLIGRKDLLELILPRDQSINNDPPTNLLVGHSEVERDSDYFASVVMRR